MKLFKIKFNDNLQAIYTYISSYKHYIDINELVDWCIQYEYYRELYENFHVVKACIEDHNKEYPDRDKVAERHSSPSVIIDAPDPGFDDDDSLL